MARYSVIGYNNQVLGEVDALDVVEAWSEAGKRFKDVLDIRQASKYEAITWVEGPFEWYSPIGERVLLSGKMWSKRGWFSEYDNTVAVTQLIPDLAEDLREEMEPEEYLGVIESGNIVVMAGDADGFHNIKVFPSFDAAFIEAKELISTFSTYDEMEESGYFDRNNYSGLPRGGA